MNSSCSSSRCVYWREALQVFVIRSPDTARVAPLLFTLLPSQGHETSSNTLTWVVYEICHHPEVLTKLIEETLRVCGPTRPPSYDDLGALEYTTAIINETLRLRPVVPFTARVANETTQLMGYTVPRGSGVFVNFKYAKQVEGSRHGWNLTHTCTGPLARPLASGTSTATQSTTPTPQSTLLSAGRQQTRRSAPATQTFSHLAMDPKAALVLCVCESQPQCQAHLVHLFPRPSVCHDGNEGCVGAPGSVPCGLWQS